MTDHKVEFDDPSIPEFRYWDSFGRFSKRVQQGARHILAEIDRAFLDTVLATSTRRKINLKPNHPLFRARKGFVRRPVYDEERIAYEEPAPFGRDEMKPLEDRSPEGRVNPKGVPVLYLSTTRETAMSEIRP
ncbi:MAG: RES domain-containing protein [Alphaproteobacteria bacterium]|nr:RES domain-containing protein [Alphaproteobacteria bacterium]